MLDPDFPPTSDQKADIEFSETQFAVLYASWYHYYTTLVPHHPRTVAIHSQVQKQCRRMHRTLDWFAIPSSVMCSR